MTAVPKLRMAASFFSKLATAYSFSLKSAVFPICAERYEHTRRLPSPKWRTFFASPERSPTEVSRPPVLDGCTVSKDCHAESVGHSPKETAIPPVLTRHSRATEPRARGSRSLTLL